MDPVAAPGPTTETLALRFGGAPRRHRDEPPSVGPSPAATSDDVDDLSARLALLERDLRRAWAALVERDAGMAGRVGHAGRLVHRAAAILEPSTIY